MRNRLNMNFNNHEPASEDLHDHDSNNTFYREYLSANILSTKSADFETTNLECTCCMPYSADSSHKYDEIDFIENLLSDEQKILAEKVGIHMRNRQYRCKQHSTGPCYNLKQVLLEPKDEVLKEYTKNVSCGDILKICVDLYMDLSMSEEGFSERDVEKKKHETAAETINVPKTNFFQIVEANKIDDNQVEKNDEVNRIDEHQNKKKVEEDQIVFAYNQITKHEEENGMLIAENQILKSEEQKKLDNDKLEMQDMVKSEKENIIPIALGYDEKSSSNSSQRSDDGNVAGQDGGILIGHIDYLEMKERKNGKKMQRLVDSDKKEAEKQLKDFNGVINQVKTKDGYKETNKNKAVNIGSIDEESISQSYTTDTQQYLEDRNIRQIFGEKNALINDYMSRRIKKTRRRIIIKKYNVNENRSVNTDSESSCNKIKQNMMKQEPEIITAELPSVNTKQVELSKIVQEAEQRMKSRNAMYNATSNRSPNYVKKYVLSERNKISMIKDVDSVNDLKMDILLGKIYKRSINRIVTLNWFQLRDLNLSCFNSKPCKLFGEVRMSERNGDIMNPESNDTFFTKKYALQLNSTAFFLNITPNESGILTRLPCWRKKETLINLENMTVIQANEIDGAFHILLKSKSGQEHKHMLKVIEMVLMCNNVSYYLRFYDATEFLKWNLAFELRLGKTRWPIV